MASAGPPQPLLFGQGSTALQHWKATAQPPPRPKAQGGSLVWLQYGIRASRGFSRAHLQGLWPGTALAQCGGTPTCQRSPDAPS